MIVLVIQYRKWRATNPSLTSKRSPPPRVLTHLPSQLLFDILPWERRIIKFNKLRTLASIKVIISHRPSIIQRAFSLADINLFCTHSFRTCRSDASPHNGSFSQRAVLTWGHQQVQEVQQVLDGRAREGIREFFSSARCARSWNDHPFTHTQWYISVHSFTCRFI